MDFSYYVCTNSNSALFGSFVFVILIFVKLVQKVNPKVPLTLVPFLITVVGLSIGSIGEPYLLEFKTHAYFVIAGIIVTLCSMPILKVVKP